jgi:hypothetical protein
MDRAVARYQAGQPAWQAAVGYCDRSTLLKELAKRGIPRRSAGPRGQQNPHRDAAMLAHYEAGLNCREIGDIFGITRTGALFAIRRARRAA